MIKKTKGFSLIEVLLAIAILGVVSTILINGLVSSRATSNKVAINAKAFTTLDSAAQIVDAAGFRGCAPKSQDNRLKDNPYFLSVSLPAGVSWVRVDGMRATGEWKSCSDADWTTNSTAIQRIILSTSYAAGGKTIQRTLIKTFSGSSYAEGYNVKITTPDGDAAKYDIKLGPIPGPGGWSDSEFGYDISLKVTKNQSTSCFVLLNSDVTTDKTFSPQLINSCPTAGQTTKLRVNLPGATSLTSSVNDPLKLPPLLPGTYNIDIGAFDTSNGDFASPATLRVTIKPAMQVSVSSGTPACTGVRSRTSLANACVVELKVIDDTGTGALKLVKLDGSDSDCRVVAYSVGTGDTWARCAFATTGTTTLQTNFGSYTTSVRLYLWREQLTGTLTTDQHKAVNWCSTTSGSNNYYKDAAVKLKVKEPGSFYSKEWQLANFSVTC